jgi:hypothetical protein
MRKISLLFLFLLSINLSFGQRFLGALAFGGNLTQVDGDEVYGFKKPGFNVGAATFLPIQEKWFVSMEVAFSQKGAYQKYPWEADPSKDLPFYNLRLNYVEIPVLFHFEDKQFAMLGTGFSFNRLVGAKEIEWGQQTTTDSRNGVYSINDFNWMVDVRLRLYKSLRLNFRFAYSLSSIRTREYSNLSGDTWTRNQFNNILTLRLVYTFNETIRPRPEDGA